MSADGRRMHGFSVSVSAPAAASDDGEVVAPAMSSSQKKRPRETSLPSLGGEAAAFDGGTPSRNRSSRRSASASGMRVVVPDGRSPGRPGTGSASRSMPAPARLAYGSDMPADEEDDEQYDQDGEYSDEMSPSASASNESSPADTPDGVPKQPGTPLGRVVEPGQEHTGRWTKEEHEAFLTGLQLYGKEWKKVAAKVKTRTVVQTRTHAQKYFQKLQKVMKSSGDDGQDEAAVTVEMGTVSVAKQASPPSSSLRAYQNQKTKSGATPSSSSSSKARPPDGGGFPPFRVSPKSSTTEAAAHLMTQMSSGPSQPSPASSSPQAPAALGQYAAPRYGRGAPAVGSMKIVAPAHDAASKRGKFPEPSPAACGKRKLAEIAAAQMLAGAMISAGGLSKDKRESSSAEAAKDIGSFSGTAATPPPEDGGDPSDVGDITPPLTTSLKDADGRSAGGGFLQIVNPDSLNETNDGGTKKRGFQGMPSPMTPWDGQLKALVSDMAGNEGESDNGNGPGFPGLPDLHVTEEKPPAPLASSASAVRPSPSSDLQSRSALHQSVCSGSTKEVSMVIAKIGKAEAAQLANQQDTAGFLPLHSAAALYFPNEDSFGFHEASEISRLLLSNGADVTSCDADGNTSLHWSARVGNDELTEILLMNRCPIDAQNTKGETALHWALRAGPQGMSPARLLVQNGAKISILSRDFKRPLDVSARGFDGLGPAGDPMEAYTIHEKRETRASFLSNSPQSRTLVLHHPDCLDHVPKSNIDWETPGRVQSIMDRILPQEAQPLASTLLPYEIAVSSDFERAPLDLLSRVHSAEYLRFVNDLSKELESRRKKQIIQGSEERNSGAAVAEKGDGESDDGSNSHVVPFTPMVQRSVLREPRVKNESHSDTSFSAGSLKAARRAAGAVQHAVDRVLVGRNRNAFCVVRPPGHHAGVSGLLAGGESCGFCIFNSVAAGAMHALSNESRCERVAIVDIDAHHGNGTEEIIRKCHDPGRLLFFSVHIFDHDRRKGRGAGGTTPGYQFYPGTGDQDDVAHNIINVPLAPLWREKEVSGVAVAGSATTPQVSTAEPIQTRGRTRRRGSSSEASDNPTSATRESSNGVETSSVESSSSAKAGQTTSRPPHYLLGTGRMAYRRAIQQRLLPSLRAFNPDLILMSTGFDASRDDVGNARHYVGGKQRMGLDLQPDDYAWTTKKILEIANICCQGRVVSVLEGGYGRTPPRPQSSVGADSVLPDQSAELLHNLDKTVFAECAIRHLQALVDPFDDEMRHPGSDS